MNMKSVKDKELAVKVTPHLNERGLSPGEVERSRALHGSNALTGKKSKSFLIQFKLLRYK